MDSSNTVTKEEFHQALRSIGFGGEGTPALTEQEVDILVSSFDKDGNGIIDYKEFYDRFWLAALMHDDYTITGDAITHSATSNRYIDSLEAMTAISFDPVSSSASATTPHKWSKPMTAGADGGMRYDNTNTQYNRTSTQSNKSSTSNSTVYVDMKALEDFKLAEYSASTLRYSIDVNSNNVSDNLQEAYQGFDNLLLPELKKQKKTQQRLKEGLMLNARRFNFARSDFLAGGSDGSVLTASPQITTDMKNRISAAVLGKESSFSSSLINDGRPDGGQVPQKTSQNITQNKENKNEEIISDNLASSVSLEGGDADLSIESNRNDAGMVIPLGDIRVERVKLWPEKLLEGNWPMDYELSDHGIVECTMVAKMSFDEEDDKDEAAEEEEDSNEASVTRDEL